MASMVTTTKALVRAGLAAFAVIGLAFVTLVIFVVVEVHRAPGENLGQIVRVDVARGTPFNVVVKDLHERGLVRRDWPLRAYARLRRWERKVQSGTYAFAVGERPVDLLDKMVRGDVLKIPVTVREGLTVWEISGAFGRAGIDSVAILDATRDPVICEKLDIPVPSLEGYLFPDTYHVPFGVSASDVVAQMLDRLDEVFDEATRARASEMGMTAHAVLTLASIVEAEAQVPGERSLIAGVYHNRLRRGMRLEADPTVAYAMGGYRGRLFFKDLEIESPYNTYRNPGLPPGPICSPGVASIRATLYPDTTITALYFVARGDGSHIFSLTLREHEAAIREIRSTRR